MNLNGEEYVYLRYSAEYHSTTLHPMVLSFEYQTGVTREDQASEFVLAFVISGKVGESYGADGKWP